MEMQVFLRKVNSGSIGNGNHCIWLAGAMLLNHYSSSQTAEAPLSQEGDAHGECS